MTPAQRGKGNKVKIQKGTPDQTSAEKRASMTPDQVRGRLWAKRLKRVFGIDIETCDKCGGKVRIIACIEDPAVIRKILAHLYEKAVTAVTAQLPPCRAPPVTGLFD